MKIICIDDFEDMEFKDVYGLLMLENEKSFEVRIKRHPAENTPDQPDWVDWSIFFSYYRAAYAGQKLSDIASTFSYWVPSVETLTPFRFQIEITDVEVFADVLFYIVAGYFDMDSQEWESSFENQATIFHTTAWDFNTDVACWGLVQLAGEYLDKVSG